MAFRSLVGGALLACALLTPAAARPTLDSARLGELSQYQVLTFNDPFQNGIFGCSALTRTGPATDWWIFPGRRAEPCILRRPLRPCEGSPRADRNQACAGLCTAGLCP